MEPRAFDGKEGVVGSSPTEGLSSPRLDQGPAEFRGVRQGVATVPSGRGTRMLGRSDFRGKRSVEEDVR
jgi:hypothetical protein